MTVFDRIWLRLRESISVASELEPQEALVLLVETHVDLVVDNRTATTLLLQELRSLPENYQAKARRNGAIYRDAWANAIVENNPLLSLDECRLIAESCFWLINAFDSDPVSGSIGSDRAKDLLTEMAHAALVCGRVA
jgi:Tetracyclin repressor-like, C-terminal domain